jgi:hypothetical protein
VGTLSASANSRVTAYQKITEPGSTASAPLLLAVKHVLMLEWLRQKVDGARYSENDSDKIMGRAEGWMWL